MLARTSYDPSQVATCRAIFAEMQDSWRGLAARSAAAARAEAEVRVFNQMVVALDGWFAHRQRSMEGRDSNPLREVRLLALGITAHRATFPPDSTTKWCAEASISGLAPGDAIAISEALFARLCDAFLTAITARFPG